jgi:hypothetical protein
VECDSTRTANKLYEELDGVEMESSSMVFDLSLVPEELSFEGRETRDAYSASASGAVNPNYKPPDFVVNALQHTKVQCSWDEGEKLRDRKLSNFSSWRNLNESELQQYVADSASSDDEDAVEEEDSEDSDFEAAKPKKHSKKDKKASMRKLLLGDNSEGFSDAEDDDDEEDGEGKTLTYMPELGKDLLAKKRGGAEETPYEAEQRKMAEKKKARKVAKKAYQEQQEAEKKAAVQAAKKPSAAKAGKAAMEEKPTAEEAKRQAELELLFEGEGDPHAEDDYDMRALALAEKDKARGKKSKRRKASAAAGDDDFKLDTADPRFSKLFEGDSRFGIDKTSTEFRPTPAVKEILSEQAKRRAQQERRNGSAPAPEAPVAGRNGHGVSADVGEAKSVDVDGLVNKLKRKYAKA